MNATALIGRDEQLAQLDGLVADVIAGQGRAVWIEGEPGIGKSSLLDAALGSASQHGCQVFQAAANELSSRFPLRVLLDCLAVSEASPDPLRAELAAQLHGRGMAVGAGDQVATVAEGLLALVDRLCGSSPTVVVVDDLQWADDASLAVWHRLARSVGQQPLLLVAACRPVGRQDTLSRLRREVASQGAVMLPLAPLAPAEASRMVADLLGALPGPGLQQLAERAGGNPLYLREMVDALVRENTIRLGGGVADVDTTRLGAPASLAAAIADRLGFLSRDTRAALQIAALLGAEFAVTDLSVVSGLGATALIPVIEEGLASGVLKESGNLLVFRHGLIREALAESIPTALSSELHLQAAQAMVTARASTERVAEQLLAAADSAPIAYGWALDWLVEAGPELVYRAYGMAADLLSHVVDNISDTDPHRQELISLLVTAAWYDARDAEVEKRARQFLASDHDPALGAQVAWTLAYVLLRLRRFEEAVAVTAETLADARVDDVWSARLRALGALVVLNEGAHDRAEVIGQDALIAAERAGDAIAAGYALQVLGTVRLYNPDKPSGLAYFDRGLELVRQHPEATDLYILLLLNRCVALEHLDRLAEAVSSSREAVLLADRAASRARLATARFTSGELLYVAGHWDDAIAELENMDALYWQDDLVAAGVLALIAAHRDERATTDRLLGRLDGQDFSSAGMRINAHYVIRARACVAVRDGDPRRALELLAELQRWGWDTFTPWLWLPDLVRLAGIVDEPDIAYAAQAAVEADAAALPSAGRIAGVERCRGLIDGDPEPLLSAADRYRSTGHALELAATLEDAAVFLAERGDAGTARSTLDEALAGYADLGAELDLRRAVARARRYGMQRGQRGDRRRPPRGWEALTPTEVRVAELVAEGSSNPDIAAALFLSRRTVQTHVSHILTKLGARSRVEIVQQAARRLDPTAVPEA